MAAATKRCFEYRDPPSHNKFWTIEVAGTTAFVTYGKIGSGGATQVKVFGTARQADEFSDKMMREKRLKGYREVGPAAYPGAPSQQLAAAGGGTPSGGRPVAARSAPPASTPEEGDRFIDI